MVGRRIIKAFFRRLLWVALVVSGFLLAIASSVIGTVVIMIFVGASLGLDAKVLDWRYLALLACAIVWYYLGSALTLLFVGLASDFKPQASLR